MRAAAGDEVLVKGRHWATGGRVGVTVELHGADSSALSGGGRTQTI